MEPVLGFLEFHTLNSAKVAIRIMPYQRLNIWTPYRKSNEDNELETKITFSFEDTSPMTVMPLTLTGSPQLGLAFRLFMLNMTKVRDTLTFVLHLQLLASPSHTESDTESDRTLRRQGTFHLFSTWNFNFHQIVER